MLLYKIRLLRRALLPLFARCNPGDINVRHPYTGDRIVLHSFHHKGYWYHGKRREEKTMSLFASMINKGDTILEVGGHIGYISLYFKYLVGSGAVVVFEPGVNNLPYIRKNVEGKNILLVEKAAGHESGFAKFFLDPLTGQNNSLLNDFPGFRVNKANAGLSSAEAKEVTVEVVRLDDFTDVHRISPNFIKIDVEGFEWQVLQGMRSLVGSLKPRLMVEVQVNEPNIFRFLMEHDYVMFNESRTRLGSADQLTGNVFALHRVEDGMLIQRLDLQAACAKA